MRQITTPPGLNPHRGTTILVLGILSLVFQCAGWIFGIIAWVMATNDLRQMDAGIMDPAGRGNTQAGKICGIISIILHSIGLVIGLLWVFLVGGLVAAGAAAGSR